MKVAIIGAILAPRAGSIGNDLAAAQNAGIDAAFRQADARALPFRSGFFDAVLANRAVADALVSVAAAIGTAARLFTALAKSRVNVRMIDQGSSEQNIIVGVDEADLPTAIRAISGEFA